MIHYRLKCADGHDFEGWFRDSAGFGDQAARGLLSCPQCGSVDVDRALMAPSVRTGRQAARELAPPPEARAASAMPDELRAALQRLRSDVERQCDDVGDGFADAARRLHDNAARRPHDDAARPPHDDQAAPVGPSRGIYGQATASEREALAEEGIEIMRIPWLPRAES